MISNRVQEVESSWIRKTGQAVRHRFNIYAGSYFALALWRGDGHSKLVTRFGVIRQE